MKLIEDSISDKLHKRCVDELDANIEKHCWKSSSITWSPQVKEGVNGSCIITPVSNRLHKSLEKELKPYLPTYDELICQYFVWQHSAGISWHNDTGYDRLFGATLYLNNEWHPDNGGWFIWEDDKGYHTILPKKKFLIVSDNYEHHCVTPVALGFRCTIQIWGNKIV
tara:strand:- start:418 stop:918 length:501 start_codon:yes stop_codon:yes gene_type:complete